MVNLNQFELNFSDQDFLINYRSKLATIIIILTHMCPKNDKINQFEGFFFIIPYKLALDGLSVLFYIT